MLSQLNKLEEPPRKYVNTGDILFYLQKPGDLYDDAIVLVTQSPVVHAAVAINPFQKIEELGGGVMLNILDMEKVGYVWHYTETYPDFDIHALHTALNWAICQRGNAYGWEDAANALINSLGINLTVNTSNLLDCSAFCAEFLMKALCPLFDNEIDPHKYTPAILIKTLGVKV